MKVTKQPAKQDFQPYEIIIRVETKEEECALKELTQQSDTAHHLINTGNLTLSEATIIQDLLLNPLNKTLHQ